MSKNITICADCKHLMRKEKGSDTWYHLFCKKTGRKQEIDPVTGKMMFCETNSLGEFLYTEDRYKYCRSVNTEGMCRKFEKKSLVKRCLSLLKR